MSQLPRRAVLAGTALFVTVSLTACKKQAPEPAVPAVAPVEAPTGAELDGDWGGVLQVPLGQLRLVLHIDGEAATMDSLDQGATGIPASQVTRAGSTVTVQFAALGASFTGTARGDTLEGTFTQAGAEMPLTLERDVIPLPPVRPSEPHPPFPYVVEDVTVDAGDHTLGCSLTRPEGEGPWTAVALLSGSGPQDRDEFIAGHRPFLILSDHLTRKGIVVLRCDDRGFGASTGDFASATTDDLARDAAAMALALSARDDTGAVGFIGHSEGGLTGPLAADEADFLVLLAAPALPGDAVLRTQSHRIGLAERMTRSQMRSQETTQEQLLTAALGGDTPENREAMRQALSAAGAPEPAIEPTVARMFSPWMQRFLVYDPAPTLKGLDVPVLAIWGGKDVQVHPSDHRPPFDAAMADRSDVTVHVFPRMNHLFQVTETGAPSEYQTLETSFDAEMLEVVSTWILER